MKKTGRLVAGILAATACVGLLTAGAFAMDKKVAVGDGIELTVTQVSGGGAGEHIRVQEGDVLYYIVTLRNHTGDDLSGDIVLPLPVLAETAPISCDGAVRKGDAFYYDVENLPEGMSVCRLVAFEMPGDMGTCVDWAVNASFVRDGDDAPCRFSDDVSASFGKPVLNLEKSRTGDMMKIHVCNDKSATGSAGMIKVRFRYKDGFDAGKFEKKFPGSLTLNGLDAEVALGALVPGGETEVDVPGAEFIDDGSFMITYDGGVAVD